MHKLVILIEPLPDWRTFDSRWPEFLHLAEDMPGLLGESSGQVDGFLLGSQSFARMYEFFFANLRVAQAALGSEAGRAAGRLLQSLAPGQITLFFVEYRADDIENIRRSRGQAGA